MRIAVSLDSFFYSNDHSSKNIKTSRIARHRHEVEPHLRRQNYMFGNERATTVFYRICYHTSQDAPTLPHLFAVSLVTPRHVAVPCCKRMEIFDQKLHRSTGKCKITLSSNTIKAQVNQHLSHLTASYMLLNTRWDREMRNHAHGCHELQLRTA